MFSKNLGLTEGQIENFFREVLNLTGEIVREGSGINISNVLQIKPVVKGRFDSLDASYDPEKNCITINATISNAFSEKVMKGVVPVRVDRVKVDLDLREINGERVESSTLKRHHINEISGSGFMPNKYIFKGLTIINTAQPEQSEFVSLENLNIHKMGARRMTFIFSHKFQTPEWLKSGTTIYIKFLYQHEENKQPKESDSFPTRWELE